MSNYFSESEIVIDDHYQDVKFSRLTLPVRIVSINSTSSFTRVISNSGNFLASDISFNGEYFYFKVPRLDVLFILEEYPSYPFYDDNFIYFRSNSEVRIFYPNLDHWQELVPHPVFPYKSYSVDPKNESWMTLDGKFVTVAKVKGALAFQFNRPDVRIYSEGRMVTDLFIKKQEPYPWIEYHPFYIEKQYGPYKYEYDYSDISPVVKSYPGGHNQYFFPNIFRLFDYDRNGVVDFRENKYKEFEVNVGFRPTRYQEYEYEGPLT